MILWIVLGAAFCAIASAAHLASIFAVIARLRSHRDDGTAAEAVSILRPVCGLDNFVEETLRSTFLLDHPRYEIVFCVRSCEPCRRGSSTVSLSRCSPPSR